MSKNPNATILIVDDDPQVIKSLEIWLKNEGYKTRHAKGGAEAIRILEGEQIDIALVDLRLENEDGLEVSRKLKEACPALDIVILTGYPSYESAVEAMKIGVSDYISKGSSNEEIMRAIKKAVGKHPGKKDGCKKNQALKNGVKLILFCNHSLIQERLENISNGNPGFHLLKTFPQVDYVKIKDFLQEIDIALVCAGCNMKKFNDAYQLLPELYRCFPKIKPVLINENFSDKQKVDLLKMGIRGFASRDLSSEKLEQGLLKINEGGFLLSQSVVNLSLQTMILENPLPQVDKEAAGLTTRELDILKTMTLGLKNKEIADRLFISEKTVKTHINRIFKKLGVNNRAKAIRAVMDKKLC